ncbi:MAG: nuclear transport factor 2 family protein [Candidatus Bipolaricaulota bacterium]
MGEPRHSLSDLTEAEVRDLWTQTYNREGKPDWSHIWPYYAEDVVFRDSVQELRGLDAFQAMCQRLTGRCRQLEMHLPHVVKRPDLIFIEWEMTMRFKRFPSSVLYGTTRLELNEQGKIRSQRDYYDLWGDIFDNIPWFAGPYRRFMRRKFG